MNPKISILVPVYNTGKFLEKCLDSIINQSFKDWELIIVNDCSPDNSSKILSEYEKKDSRIKVINHQVNLGVIQARFTGLSKALGNYVVFIDSDDWIPNNSLQLLYNKIEKENADVVVGSMVKVLDKYGIIKSKPRNSVYDNNLTKNIDMPELFAKYFIIFFGVNIIPTYMCGKIYRKATLDKAPLKPTSYTMFEDMAFNLMLHPYLKRISFVPEPVYYYRLGGMTSRSTPDFLKNIKLQYDFKMENILKYNYTAAIPYIKVELINCFYSHFHRIATLDGLKYEKVRELIEEELKDDLYINKGIFGDIKMSEKVIAMKNKDYDTILRIVRTMVKKSRPKQIIKKFISKILI